MKPIVIVLGAVGLLAAGGGAALLLVNGPRQATAPAPAAPAPAVPPPAPADTSAVAPPAAPPAPAPAPTTVNFVPLVQNFSLVRDSAAYAAASQDAPQYYPLKAGTPLVSAARSPDGTWTVAMTADGRAAFLPSADLGPYDAKLAPLPDPVSGTAEVVDTGTLTIDGQTIPLAGVIGQKGEFAEQMQAKISAEGAKVNCMPQRAGGYICTLPSGLDIGRTALFNGGAEVANDASDDYRAQEEAGRAAHRGMWR